MHMRTLQFHDSNVMLESDLLMCCICQITVTSRIVQRMVCCRIWSKQGTGELRDSSIMHGITYGCATYAQWISLSLVQGNWTWHSDTLYRWGYAPSYIVTTRVLLSMLVLEFWPLLDNLLLVGWDTASLHFGGFKKHSRSPVFRFLLPMASSIHLPL